MQTDLPQVYAVLMPDESMLPWLRPGDTVRFARGKTPAAGDLVLVADAAGGAYVRTYRVRRAGQWQAQPLNEAFEPLDSQVDGLQVLGVFAGMDRSG